MFYFFRSLMDSDFNKEIRCATFNCLGFKGSHSLIEQLSSINDICFICENWLKQHELSHVQQTLHGQGKWIYLKSSMDHEVVYRPFGGVGFICKNQEGLTYRCIDVDNDRICVLQVISCQKPLLTIIGVYMPYFNGHHEQLELYVETLDVLQYTLDNYASSFRLLCF